MGFLAAYLDASNALREYPDLEKQVPPEPHTALTPSSRCGLEMDPGGLLGGRGSGSGSGSGSRRGGGGGGAGAGAESGAHVPHGGVAGPAVGR